MAAVPITPGRAPGRGVAVNQPRAPAVPPELRSATTPARHRRAWVRGGRPPFLAAVAAVGRRPRGPVARSKFHGRGVVAPRRDHAGRPSRVSQWDC